MEREEREEVKGEKGPGERERRDIKIEGMEWEEREGREEWL